MTRLTHFEITGDRPGELAAFYSGALAVSTEPSPFVEGYHLLAGSDGPLGAVMDRRYQSQPTIAWFEVDDIDACIQRITTMGGTVAGARNTIPGQGLVQYVADPNGTIFSLKQPL